jgi:anti-sigma B factor antagonist
VNQVNLATRTDVVNGDPVVTISGEVDLVTASDLRQALGEALLISPRLVVDVGAVTFIDSTGLSALADAHRRAHDAGGALIVRHPSPMLKRLLEITRLDTLLTVEEV